MYGSSIKNFPADSTREIVHAMKANIILFEPSFDLVVTKKINRISLLQKSEIETIKTTHAGFQYKI